LNLPVTANGDAALVITTIQWIVVAVVAFFLAGPDHTITTAWALTIVATEVTIVIIAIIAGFVALFTGL
tara:strand:+ start:242 stop:448 length:207 start_codon:yes stop_codon:yes gene_type:complete